MHDKPITTTFHLESPADVPIDRPEIKFPPYVTISGTTKTTHQDGIPAAIVMKSRYGVACLAALLLVAGFAKGATALESDDIHSRALLSLAAVTPGGSAPFEREQEYHLLGRKLMTADSTNAGRTNFRGNLRWGGRNHFSWGH